jgi:hypothetical protein
VLSLALEVLVAPITITLSVVDMSSRRLEGKRIFVLLSQFHGLSRISPSQEPAGMALVRTFSNQG